jgi:uncharacterized membrane protein
MMERLRKAAVVLNGFIHDFATGYWLAAMITILFLHRFRESNPAVAVLLNRIEQFFFWNTIAAVFVIFATGGMRTFTYVDNFYGPEAERTRRRMLVSKHFVLIAVFAAGGLWAYAMAFN